MKKIYESHIKIPKDEKMSEKIFNTRITLSVIAILSCLTVMLSTAFALFNSNLTQEFTMSAAVWDVDVEERSFGEVLSVYTCPPIEGEMHKFTIFSCGTATKGYCIIRIRDLEGEIKEYCTPPFTGNMYVNIQAVAGCEIRFVPRWGTPGNYGLYDICDGTITHSFTPPPEENSTEDGGIGGSSTVTENDSSQTEGSVDSSGNTLSNEVEVSSGITEASGSSNTEPSGSIKTSGDSSSSQESLSSSSNESSVSSDGNISSVSGGLSVLVSTPSQSSGDGSTSSSDSASSAGASSSGGGEASSHAVAPLGESAE